MMLFDDEAYDDDPPFREAPDGPLGPGPGLFLRRVIQKRTAELGDWRRRRQLEQAMRLRECTRCGGPIAYRDIERGNGHLCGPCHGKAEGQRREQELREAVHARSGRGRAA